jgi:hypothetical protein
MDYRNSKSVFFGQSTSAAIFLYLVVNSKLQTLPNFVQICSKNGPVYKKCIYNIMSTLYLKHIFECTEILVIHRTNYFICPVGHMSTLKKY